MSDENQIQWAIVELMGHSRTGGKVSKDTTLGTALLRLDVPVANGEFATQLINPSSIYRLTFCAEAIARVAAEGGSNKPVHEYEVRHLLPPSQPKASEAEWHGEEDDLDGRGDE